MKAYAAIDLHSSNNYVGIIDEHDKRLYGKRLPNELDQVLAALDPAFGIGWRGSWWNRLTIGTGW